MQPSITGDSGYCCQRELPTRILKELSFSWDRFMKRGDEGRSCKPCQRGASPLPTRANAAPGVLGCSHCLTAKICPSQILLYLLIPRRDSEGIMPNKFGLRSNLKSTQCVWWAWYGGEQLDLIFIYIEHLLAGLALSSILKENSSLVN